MKQASTRRGGMRVALVSAAAAAFAMSGSACSRAPETETVYCVDRDSRVVDDDYCDDDHAGGYFLWHRVGSHYFPRGAKVSGGKLIDASDPAARAKAGLPGTGRIASGTVTRGGIGDGSSSESSGG